MRNILAGGLAVALAVVAAGLLLVGGGNPAATPNRTAAAQTQQLPASSTPASSPTVSPIADEVVLVSAHGDGADIRTDTQAFQADARWDLVYTYDCSRLGGTGGTFSMEETGYGTPNASGNAAPTSLPTPVVNVQGVKGGATVHERTAAGWHTLTVESVCAWTVRATETAR